MKYYFIYSAILLFFSLFTVMGSDVDNREIIVIDPGHGGRDPGAVISNVVEAKLNLEISKVLYDVLDDEYRVIMTRDADIDLCSDTFIKRNDMNRRVSIVNSSNALLLISIHMNMYSKPQYSGAQVFYSNAIKNSKILAGCIMDTFKLRLKNTSRKETLRDNIYLLNKVCIPSVIVECGFMSNPTELNNLNDPAYQLMLSLSIKEGIESYRKKEADFSAS